MLKILVSNRLEKLLKTVHEEISKHRKHPLEKISVCVQTAGMQRWLGLKLSEISGISANLDYIFPGALMKRLVERADSPIWSDKEELVWKVFNQLHDIEEPVFETIREYVKDDINSIKTYRLAGRIADTFDQYQVYRPKMVKEWLSSKPATDLKNEDMWQPELFRKTFDKPESCKTTLFDKFIRNCQSNRVNAEQLGGTIHIFGISVLPPLFMEMLRAASKIIDINFYLLSPTSEYWGDSRSVREIRREERYRGKTAEELYIEEKHPLLDNLGMAGRDFFDNLYFSDDEHEVYELYETDGDDSVISTIQNEILNLEAGNTNRENDNSIVIENCHNPQREVETLYDHLLDSVNSNPDIAPSDILVMIPEIEKYVPYIRSVFDNPYEERMKIPYSIADISEKMSNRQAGIFLELIRSLRGDFSLHDAMKLMSYDIIADNFNISQADLSEISETLESNGAFWGFDDEHLKFSGVDTEPTFSWEQALRRIALALAEGESMSVYSVASGEGVRFSSAEKLGHLMRFIETASSYAKKMREVSSPSGWCMMLMEIYEDFMGESQSPDESLFLTKSIGRINEEIIKSGIDRQIPFDPIFERLDKLLTEISGSKGFMSGQVTFCAMLPMRSIPFKHICIIGLNENTFPRQKKSLEFDLIAKKPMAGDRSNRDSDRYLFLETILSARNKLYLSYIGQSERDNSLIPPSTLISELSRHLDDRFGITDIEKREKLHSFSRDYFSGGKLFTYSQERFEAANSFNKKECEKQFIEKEIDTEEVTEVSLRDFESFFINPAEMFMKNILGLNTKTEWSTFPETERMTLSPLEKYNIKKRALDQSMAGKDFAKMLAYQKLLAQLPPENMGEYEKFEIENEIDSFKDEINSITDDKPSEITVAKEIDGLTIKGEVGGITDAGHIFITLSEIKPKAIARCWLRHLILSSVKPMGTYLISPENTLKMSPVADQNILIKLVKDFRSGIKKPPYFHITEGYLSLDKEMKFKQINSDKYDNAKESLPFKTCFKDNYDPTKMREYAMKFFAPIISHTEEM